MSGKARGIIFILMADLLWGIAGSVNKYVMYREVPPQDLAQVRLTISVLLLAAVFALFNRRLLKIRPGDLAHFAVFGVVGVAGTHFFYFYAIRHTSVASALFLEYLFPVLVFIFAVLTRRDRISFKKTLALAGAVLGGLLIAWGTEGGLAVSYRGIIGGLAAAVCFAAYSIYAKYVLYRYNPWTMLLWGMITGSVAWALFRPPWQTLALYDATYWPVFTYIAVFSLILPFGFFLVGLYYLDPVAAGITSTTEPVLAGIAAYLILGESLTPVQAAGCALVLAAVVLVQTGSQNKETTAGSGGGNAGDLLNRPSAD